jgi:hypothetical protein
VSQCAISCITDPLDAVMAIVAVLLRDERTAPDAAALAHIMSAIMFVAMAQTINSAKPVDDVVQEIRAQVRVILPL